jgi:cold shock CspA family protein
MTDLTQEANQRYTGIVKWFDTKKGYGLITMLEAPYLDEIIFVHHTEIAVKLEQYRYLVTGEYISCVVANSVNKTVKLYATDIKGVLDGQVMCETLNDQKLLKDAYHTKRRQEPVQPPTPPSASVKPAREPKVSKVLKTSNIKENRAPQKRKVA